MKPQFPTAIRRARSSRLALGASVVAATTFALASPSSADHTHSKKTGNGTCVLLAPKGGEDQVSLPYATEQQVEATRAHPIHLRVHLGQPGSDGSIGVYGSAGDPCADSGRYVNLRTNIE